MVFLVYLLSLLFCIPAAWSSDISRSTAVHHLHLVYGSERIQSHFLSHEELDQAVQTVQQNQQEWFDSSRTSHISSRSLSTPDEISESNRYGNVNAETVLPQLTCVLYTAGPQAKTALLQTFGAEHVSTLHASKSDNRACFLVTTTLQRLQQVMGGENGGGVASSGSRKSAGFDSLRTIDFV